MEEDEILNRGRDSETLSPELSLDLSFFRFASTCRIHSTQPCSHVRSQAKEGRKNEIEKRTGGEAVIEGGSDRRKEDKNQTRRENIQNRS